VQVAAGAESAGLPFRCPLQSAGPCVTPAEPPSLLQFTHTQQNAFLSEVAEREQIGQQTYNDSLADGTFIVGHRAVW
jgi:hypothetical protein